MIRDIRISAVLNGFEVNVDCQTLVFTDVTEMLKEIRRYLKKPEEVEKEYLEKALNAKHIVSQNPARTAPFPYTITDSTSAAFPPSQWRNELFGVTTLPNFPIVPQTPPTQPSAWSHVDSFSFSTAMPSTSTSYYSPSNQNLSNPSVGTT